MTHFGLGSPSSTGTAAKPPVQPAFGGFGTAATSTVGFNTQPSHGTGFQSGFGSPMTNPPATSATTSSIGFGGFGGFGSPSAPTPAGNQPFGGFATQSNMSAFGSADKPPTSSSTAGGFQSGFGNTSGNLFGGFG
ncbi:hypothetical protein BD408DRAFT_419919 [Parasitella parasitica]|nr:hypothetical protein BD408DRAFT_419919 [Parasitella parasitica]